MKFLILFPFLCIILSCRQSTHSIQDEDSGSILKNDKDSQLYYHLFDSLRGVVDNNVTQKMAYDTIGLSTAPVKVLSARPYEEEYSSYKGVQLSWKNVSGKTIDAIRFKWYGVNAFNEPADMGSTQNGIGGGFTDDPLRKGATTSANWNILSRDLKKIIIAYPTEIAFADGSKWKLVEH